MTERLQASEESFRDSAAQLQGVITCAVDGIIAIDERGIIQWLNPAALKLFGYAPEEVVGKNINLLMPEPYHSEHDAYMANYIRTGQRKIIGIGREVQGRRKDGATFPMDLAVSEVRVGERRVFTGIVRDISQRKEVERALVAAKEAAEAASKAKDHLLAVVSHELRTPLTPILATACFLQERADLPADVLDEIALIRRNAEHEARLVDDLLNLTRLMRGKIDLHQEIVDAHALLRNVLIQFQGEMDAKSIRPSVSLEAKNRHVWADPGRIQQVIFNLVSNAIKFTPEQGQIRLRTFDNAAGGLSIKVSDTGIGIEPDVLPRLFNAFEQGERTITRKYGGLGLGLAIAKGIVDLHHGTLTARSEGRDRGATFTIEMAALPAVPEGNSVPAPLGAAAPAGPSILLVEDHPDTLFIIAKLLKRFGCNVTTATNVKDALSRAADAKFDLLISDIGLPDGSGTDIMRSLRGKAGLRGVALTGFGEEEDRRRSREAGFSDHLVKPVTFEMLEKIVHTLRPN